MCLHLAFFSIIQLPVQWVCICIYIVGFFGGVLEVWWLFEARRHLWGEGAGSSNCQRSILNPARPHELILTKKASSESILCPTMYSERPAETAVPVMYAQGIFVIHCGVRLQLWETQFYLPLSSKNDVSISVALFSLDAWRAGKSNGSLINKDLCEMRINLSNFTYSAW